MLYKVIYTVEAYVEADSAEDAEQKACYDDEFELKIVTESSADVAPPDTDLDLLFKSGRDEDV